MRGAAGLTQIGASMIGLDSTTLLFACAVAAGCALLVAVMPALQASLLRPVDALKRGAASIGGQRFDMRAPLVVTQIALALVLLAGAGLMLRSGWHLQATGAGIDPEGLLTARISLPSAAYNAEAGTRFYTALVERLRGVPGVDAVGLGNCLPASGGCNSTSIDRKSVV